MDRQMLLHYVAPCSPFCYTCPALQDGAIAECARKLCSYFEGYYDFNEANIPERYRSWLDEFDAFQKRLERFTHPRCPGCRNNPGEGNGCIPGCVVSVCTKARGIDYCADCPEFPCDEAKTFFAGVNSVIGEDWLRGSSRIREVGVEAYFQEKKDVSHYISYKK